jgi:hypothetical protein
MLRGVLALLAVVGAALLGMLAPAQASAATGDGAVDCEGNGSWQPGTGSSDHGLQFAQSNRSVCQRDLVDVPPEPTPSDTLQLNVPSGVIPGIDFGTVLQTFHFGPGL